jgi:hypothetical protein
MKTLFSAFGGAILVTEQNEIVTVTLDESVGGGQASGVVVGKGTIVFQGPQAIKLAAALLNSVLPAALLPLAQVVEGVAAQAIAALA